jgi:hypothetical protein
VLEQLALGDAREHLHAATAVRHRPQAHEVQLTRVAHPRRAVQRTIDILAPPQPDVELARAHAPLIGVVEARQRVVALARRELDGCICWAHVATPAFEEGGRADSLFHAPKPLVTKQ